MDQFPPKGRFLQMFRDAQESLGTFQMPGRRYVIKKDLIIYKSDFCGHRLARMEYLVKGSLKRKKYGNDNVYPVHNHAHRAHNVDPVEQRIDQIECKDDGDPRQIHEVFFKRMRLPCEDEDQYESIVAVSQH